jgi:hypothetical protein
VAVQFPPLDLLVLQPVLVQVLDQPLDFGGLEQADHLQLVAHEQLTVARQFGD